MGSLVATIVLSVLAFGLLVPVLVVFVECVAALLPGRRRLTGPRGERPNVVVLVPAHNEEIMIRATVGRLLKEATGQDRVVVVADNCSDRTAAIAREAGAVVVERNDPSRIGKGYALDYGIRYLEKDPPEVVVIIDADCEVAPGAIETIAREAASRHRPVQAVGVLKRVPGISAKESISVLAFLMKNVVRPRGLQRLGFPCLLAGPGMGFPWDIIREAPLATDSRVEDMHLGIDLAVAGCPAVHCGEARVTSPLPGHRAAALSQHTQWEHGHLSTLLSRTGPLMAAGLRRHRADLFAMALDLAVPPLALLVILLVLTGSGAFLGGFLGVSWIPLIVIAGAMFLLGAAVLAAWARFGRETVPCRLLLAIPAYVVWKIPLYLKFLVRPQRTWVRTERDATSP